MRLCLFLATSAGTTLEGRDLVITPLEMGAPAGLAVVGGCRRILAADSFRTKMPWPKVH